MSAPAVAARVPAPVPLSAVARRLEAASLLVETAADASGVASAAARPPTARGAASAERATSNAASPTDPTLTGVSDDSRTTRQGDLFCAWTGTTADGHAYVGAAARAGAAAAVVERRVDAVLPQLVVRDGRRAAAIGADVVYGEPSRALRLVGVTGTNGKTTTVWILRHLLGARWPAASIGTLGAILEDGSVLPGSENLTTPGPVQLARTLRLFVDRGVQALAMETSSHALHQGRIHALRFDAAVFTNLSRDHLDYHGTLEAYLAAKVTLLDLLREDGCAVVNADDAAWTDVAARARRRLRFGRAGDADVRASDVELGADGATFVLSYTRRAVQVTLPLLADFNVSNALGAAAAVLALGYGLDEVAALLATVPQVPGRLERIADTPCPVLRDYAHTPDALERALRSLRPLTSGRLIVVFGAGGDRDRGKRPLMGAAAEANADVAIVTSDNPRTEDPDAIIDEIVAGMDVARVVREPDRRRAIARALEIANAEDVVLLAGKGHETYQVVGTATRPFDERLIVRDLLSGAAGPLGEARGAGDESGGAGRGVSDGPGASDPWNDAPRRPESSR